MEGQQEPKSTLTFQQRMQQRAARFQEPAGVKKAIVKPARAAMADRAGTVKVRIPPSSGKGKSKSKGKGTGKGTGRSTTAKRPREPVDPVQLEPVPGETASERMRRVLLSGSNGRAPKKLNKDAVTPKATAAAAPKATTPASAQKATAASPAVQKIAAAGKPAQQPKDKSVSSAQNSLIVRVSAALSNLGKPHSYLAKELNLESNTIISLWLNHKLPMRGDIDAQCTTWLETLQPAVAPVAQTTDAAAGLTKTIEVAAPKLSAAAKKTETAVVAKVLAAVSPRMTTDEYAAQGFKSKPITMKAGGEELEVSCFIKYPEVNATTPRGRKILEKMEQRKRMHEDPTVKARIDAEANALSAPEPSAAESAEDGEAKAAAENDPPEPSAAESAEDGEAKAAAAAENDLAKNNSCTANAGDIE